MFYEIEGGQLLALIMIAIPVHAIWAIMSRKWHPLYLLAILLLVLAPFSIARDSAPIIVALKYGRAYCGFLLVFVGLLMLVARHARLGVASKGLLGFFTFYVLACFWSDGGSQMIGLALMERLRFALLLLGGLLMGLTLNSRQEFRGGVRLLYVACVVWAVLLAIGISAGHFSGGRLAMFGMNANQVAMGCGFTFLISLCTAINDRSSLVRISAYVVSGTIALGAVLTGSRSGVGALVISSIPLIAPLVRRPAAFATFALLATSVAYFASGYIVSESAFERLGSTENTRRDVWAKGLELAAEAPVFGHGFVKAEYHLEGQFAFNSHSIYLTVLDNAGAVGMIAFVIAVVMILRQQFRALHVLAHEDKRERWPAHLAIAMLLAPLSCGVFENAPVTGVSIYTLSLGLSAGLADWILSERFGFASSGYAMGGAAGMPVMMQYE